MFSVLTPPHYQSNRKRQCFISLFFRSSFPLLAHPMLALTFSYLLAILGCSMWTSTEIIAMNQSPEHRRAVSVGQKLRWAKFRLRKTKASNQPVIEPDPAATLAARLDRSIRAGASPATLDKLASALARLRRSPGSGSKPRPAPVAPVVLTPDCFEPQQVTTNIGLVPGPVPGPGPGPGQVQVQCQARPEPSSAPVPVPVPVPAPVKTRPQPRPDQWED